MDDAKCGRRESGAGLGVNVTKGPEYEGFWVLKQQVAQGPEGSEDRLKIYLDKRVFRYYNMSQRVM